MQAISSGATVGFKRVNRDGHNIRKKYLPVIVLMFSSS